MERAHFRTFFPATFAISAVAVYLISNIILFYLNVFQFKEILIAYKT